MVFPKTPKEMPRHDSFRALDENAKKEQQQQHQKQSIDARTRAAVNDIPILVYNMACITILHIYIIHIIY